MADVTVRVETPPGITLEACVLPGEYSPDVFIPDLVLQLGLPFDMRGGVAAREAILSTYALYNVSRGRHLNSHEKLDEAGVSDGDVLRLVPLHEPPRPSPTPQPKEPAADATAEAPLTFVAVTIDTPHHVIENCMIPDHFTAERVVVDLAEELSLLRLAADGTPISYGLLRVGSESLLPAGKTLHEAGIKNGETLRLVSDYFRRYVPGAG